MREKITSFDVARRAGVSRSAVSLILNNSTAVSFSEDARQRVLRAAADLGYRPNSAARMLVRGSTETIGLIISDANILPTDGFIPQVLLGISEANREHGYHILLDALHHQIEGNPYENLVESRRIDGLIVLNPRTNDPDLKAIIKRRFPAVVIGSVREPEEHSVNFDSKQGIAAAVDLLAGMGHRRIGTVPFSAKGLFATDIRIALLRKELSRHNIALPASYIEYGRSSAESGHAATLRLLERHPEITAIMAGNDTIAIGVVSAANQIGRLVPDRMSVIGFDDLPFAAWLNPPLTTIQVDAKAQGVRAAELLIDLLHDEPVDTRRITLPTKLVSRASCAAPPAP